MTGTFQSCYNNPLLFISLCQSKTVAMVFLRNNGWIKCADLRANIDCKVYSYEKDIVKPVD